MKRRAIAIGSAAALGVGAGAGTAWWRSRHAEPMPPGSGRPSVGDVWSASVFRPDGTALPLAPLRGRPLLVNFWASWCVPCVTELPLLDRFHASQQARGTNGWQVVALALDRAVNVRRFLEKTPLAMPVGILDAEAYDLPRRLGNDSGGLPFSVLHDVQGRVALRHLGAVTEGLLSQWVASLN